MVLICNLVKRTGLRPRQMDLRLVLFVACLQLACVAYRSCHCRGASGTEVALQALRPGATPSAGGARGGAATPVSKLSLLRGRMKRSKDKQVEAVADVTAAAATTTATPDPPLEGLSVGIDLGTTNSAISIVDKKGKPIIVPLRGFRVVPSIISYPPSGGVLVGEEARVRMQSEPRTTFSSIKRIIGRSFEDVKRTDKSSLFKIKSLPVSAESNALRKGHTKVALECGSTTLLPEDISAEVLKYLLRQCSAELDNAVICRAVITVPAYFLPEQCAATERAAKLAGLTKVKLLREPEAAALAYGLTQKEPQIVLVFDLGGGTFDVSVLEVGGGFVEVIATSGDSYLGGDDFDNTIVSWLIDQFALVSPEGSRMLKSDMVASRKLHAAAEAAKITLSSDASADIMIPDLYGGVDLHATLSRVKFDSLCKGVLVRILRPLREVAIMAGINLPGESGVKGFSEEEEEDDEGEEGGGEYSGSVSSLRRQQLGGRQEAKSRKKLQGSSRKELRRLQKSEGDNSLAVFPGGRQLDDVILVGGATRTPAVLRLVRSMTGINPRRSVNPDEVVSLGAAVLAGILDGSIKDMQVMSHWQASMYRAFQNEKKS